MHSLHKQIGMAIFFAVFFCGTAFGESDLDFFFKTNEQYKDDVVKEIVSTDTIRLQGKVGEKDELVKLIGLRAPQPPKKKTEEIKRNEYGIVIKGPVSPLTPLEKQAFEFVRELLEGQHVRLEFDSEKNSEENETLAYIFLISDNTFVNTEVLRHGFAHLSIRPPNMKYANELRAAYKEARAEQRGLQAQ